MTTSRKAAGLSVCALIAAWTAFSGMSARVSAVASDADGRLAELEYHSSRTASRVADLEEQVGSTRYGDSQADRLDSLEGRIKAVGSRVDGLESKVDRVESATGYGSPRY